MTYVASGGALNSTYSLNCTWKIEDNVSLSVYLPITFLRGGSRQRLMTPCCAEIDHLSCLYSTGYSYNCHSPVLQATLTCLLCSRVSLCLAARLRCEVEVLGRRDVLDVVVTRRCRRCHCPRTLQKHGTDQHQIEEKRRSSWSLQRRPRMAPSTVTWSVCSTPTDCTSAVIQAGTRSGLCVQCRVMISSVGSRLNFAWHLAKTTTRTPRAANIDISRKPGNRQRTAIHARSTTIPPEAGRKHALGRRLPLRAVSWRRRSRRFRRRRRRPRKPSRADRKQCGPEEVPTTHQTFLRL